MAFNNGEQFKLQIFDDGAGEYLFSYNAINQVVAGNQLNAQSASGGGANSGNAVGPFILPSPLAITKPGLLTIQISNVNTTEDSTIEAYVALVFAIPKKCKGHFFKGGFEGEKISPKGLVV